MLISLITRLTSKVQHRLVIFKTSLQTNLKMSGDCRPSVLFVLGAPGSGKGTQCANIVEKFNFAHLSAGDLLRAERNTPGSPYGNLIEEHIRNGTIVPVKITCSLIDRAMHAHAENFFLIDGFPRNKDNLDGWEREMKDKVNVLGVLFFNCSDEVCTTRCLARGAAGSGRSDDNEESLRKRFVTYKNDTMPIIDYYKQQELLNTIDGDRLAEEIFNDVQKVINRIAPSTVKC